MADDFSSMKPGLDPPYVAGVAVVPHDTTLLAKVTRGLWVGGAGNISVLMFDGNAVTIIGVPAGTLLPLRVQRVNATATTATNMVALT